MAELVKHLPPAGKDRVLVDDEWVLHPAAAELRRRIECGATMSDALWQKALIRSGAIRFREAWPIWEPWAIYAWTPSWLPSAHIRLRPKNSTWSHAEGGKDWWGPDSFLSVEWLEARYQPLGLLELGQQVVRFEASVARGDSYMDPRPWEEQLLWIGELSLPVRPVESIDAVLPPIHGERITTAVEQGIELRADEEGSWISFSPDADKHPILEGVAVGIRAELLRDGDVVRSRDLFAMAGDDYDDWAGACLFTPGEFDALVDLGSGRWSLRIRNSPNEVLRLWAARAYWSGEMEFLLGEEFRSWTLEERTR